VIHEHAVTLRRVPDSTAAGGVVRDDTRASGCGRRCAALRRLEETESTPSPWLPATDLTPRTPRAVSGGVGSQPCSDGSVGPQHLCLTHLRILQVVRTWALSAGAVLAAPGDIDSTLSGDVR
jgi:hypothetical protein